MDSLRDKCKKDDNLRDLEKFDELMNVKMREYKLRDMDKSFKKDYNRTYNKGEYWKLKSEEREE